MCGRDSCPFRAAVVRPGRRAGSLMALALTSFGVGIPGLFLATALLNVVVAVYIYSLVPEFLLRFIAWILVHTFYRIRLVGAERIPSHGAAVLVCNHVSFVDAVVIMAESPRPIRFVMDYRIFRAPFVGWRGSSRGSPAVEMGSPSWGGLLKSLRARALKSLIFQRFGPHPEFLWITLLTSGLDSLPSLENQGSGWIARKKSKVQTLYKSTT